MARLTDAPTVFRNLTAALNDYNTAAARLPATKEINITVNQGAVNRLMELKTLLTEIRNLSVAVNTGVRATPQPVVRQVARNAPAGTQPVVAQVARNTSTATQPVVGQVSKNTSVAQTPSRPTRPSAAARTSSGNAVYKALGPSPISSDGGATIGFLKGMGIAYGIAGAGQAVSQIVKDATNYDNITQTTRNILSSHDTRGNFAGRFAQMEQIVRNVGVETKFTAPEVAGAAKYLAMAGLRVEEINKSIRPIADIALIGDTDIAQTADVVTNIMTAYNKDASQMRSIADVLTNTFTMSNTTLMEMAESFKYCASILDAGKVRIEESAAAIGVLGDAGIKGSQAGTTLRTIMANINNPTKKQKSAWSALGIDPTGKDPLTVFEKLAEKDLTVADFYRIFHKTAAQGAIALVSHIDKWKEIIIENAVSDGMSSRLADAKKNTIEGLWYQLTSMFTENGMGAFSGIQGAIKTMLKNAIDYLKLPEVGEKFKSFAQDLIGFVKLLKTSIAQIMGYFQQFGWAGKPARG